jgi:cytochrome c5
MPAGSSAETIVAAAPASPAVPTGPAPAAATPVVVRPSAPSPAVPAPVPVPALSAPPATVTPVRVGLPVGPGRETVQQVCTGCHAIGMVTANGRTSDGWAEIIERMMGLGLEASDEDLQTVHAYLTREFPPRRAN